MLGFETIGNATLTCFDGEPILVTDPWITDSCYFGSWTLGTSIPKEQLDSILRCKYVWFSHGHPDHLNAESLSSFTGKQILLPDHVGGRIASSLRGMGFSVTVLPDREWVDLSPRIRVLCISDYYQDGILLVEMNKDVILMNLNDSAPRGHLGFLRRITEKYKKRILLKTFGYGDIDMMNFFDSEGTRIVPQAQKKAREEGGLGGQLQFWGKCYGATDIIPFSSFHEYQRLDSIWASEYTAPISAFYKDGTCLGGIHIHPAYVRWDCISQLTEEIRPETKIIVPKAPEEFGDSWSDQLEKDDITALKTYFLKIDKIWDIVDYIEVVVGGVSTIISRKTHPLNRGLKFELPRNSLMTAVKYEVFDDLMIGNFMKTTFLGTWKNPTLQEFTPIIGKIADNGLARSSKEVQEYLAVYRSRFPVDFMLHSFGRSSERIFRNFFSRDSLTFKTIKKIYSLAK